MKKLYSLLAIAAIGFSVNAQIVISELYGGGGGATAVYINDFVELKNIGTTVQTLNGASLQYASTAGTFNSYAALPSITLNPGQKYLIEMIPDKANTAGAALPTADFQMTSNTSFSSGNTFNGGFNMAAANGKVALSKDLTQISSPSGANVLDFVGYGTANAFEGTGAAPALDTANSATRTGGDTNDNATDFAKMAPSPENSSTLAVSDVAKGKATLVKNSLVANELQFATKGDIKIVNVNGQVVKAASVNDGTTLNVSNLAKGMYIVTGNVNGENVSQKIIKK